MLLKNEKFCGQGAIKCASHVCDNHLSMQFQKGFSCVLSSCWVGPYSAGEMDQNLTDALISVSVTI